MSDQVFLADSLEPDNTDGIKIPSLLPVLPLRDVVAFPEAVLPLTVGRKKSVALIDDVMLKDKLVALVAQKDAGIDEPTDEDIFKVGVAASVVKMMKFPDSTTRIIVQGISRIRLGAMLNTDPFFVAEVNELKDEFEDSTDIRALGASVVSQFVELVSLMPNAPEELKVMAMNLQPPGRLVDFIAAHLNLPIEERQELLAALSVQERLEKIAQILGRELGVAQLGQKIQSSVQERVEKGQREFYLREQMRAIKKELGEDDANPEIEEFRTKISEANLSEEALKEAEKELSRLENMPPSAAEYSVISTYLDWMVELPWDTMTEGELDVKEVRSVLDADHWGLEKIKERIIEFVAVRKLKADSRGPILCFVGPPGVGKTSLGQSIARSLSRKFVRMSLGGVRDEAEIRGHRRTYVGAMPGKIMQALRRAGSRDPLIMLDEVDKLGADYRGDPSSALLEVLDPEQNNTFADHYIGVPFDLSRVMFIVTANVLDTIPGPLRDRLEIISLAGYTEDEKLQIAKRHLVPRQLDAHGITEKIVKLADSAILGILREYAREAGVRNLEREIANILRKIAVKVAKGEAKKSLTVKADSLKEYLGSPRRFVEVPDRTALTGVSVGLAWTSVGGEILFIESTRMSGRGSLQITGHLGEVMQESVRTALSLIHSRAKELGIDDEVFSKEDIHVHIPEGATPKDGPSAGVAIVASLVSLLTGRKLRPDTAMTGEITLRGKVLPVGGIKEKVLAAKRAKLKNILLPEWNESDLEDIPDAHRKELNFKFVKNIDDVLLHIFADGKKVKPKKTVAKSKKVAKKPGKTKKATKKKAKTKKKSKR